MGKVTHHGWYSSSDEIPQPISILMGSNLRKASSKDSKPQKQPPKPEPKDEDEC